MIPVGPGPMPDAAVSWVVRTLGHELASSLWTGSWWAAFVAGLVVASLGWLALIVLALLLDLIRRKG